MCFTSSHRDQTPHDTALTSLRQCRQHISSSFFAIVMLPHDPVCTSVAALHTSILPLACMAFQARDCSARQKSPGKGRWWRWGKKIAIGGVVLGAGHSISQVPHHHQSPPSDTTGTEAHRRRLLAEAAACAAEKAASEQRAAEAQAEAQARAKLCPYVVVPGMLSALHPYAAIKQRRIRQRRVCSSAAITLLQAFVSLSHYAANHGPVCMILSVACSLLLYLCMHCVPSHALLTAVATRARAVGGNWAKPWLQAGPCSVLELSCWFL